VTTAGRYVYTAACALGVVLVVLGFTMKPHHCWVHDLGGLLNVAAIAVSIIFMRRDLSVILPRLQCMCESAGVSFSADDVGVRWRYPLALVTLWLSVCFQIGGLVFKIGRTTPIHFVSDGITFVSIASLFLFFAALWRMRRALRELKSVVGGEGLAASPPKAAKFMLLLVPRRHREHLIGDLEEEYIAIVLPEYGPRKAKLWYWWQVIFSVGPLLWAQVKRGVAIAWLWKRVR
jgi:hypothetical protein